MIKQLNTMFIVPVEHGRCYRKSFFLELWTEGKPFKHLRGDEILSVRTVHEFRDKYDRICIQYDMGIVEV